MNFEGYRHGILPSQWIREAVDEGVIISPSPLAPGQIQPNSLDLRLGSVGYRIHCSFLPGDEGMMRKLEKFQWYDFPVSGAGMVLERNQVYLFPLQESLNLPSELSARGNPKSTTGRLDIFTRLVTEHGETFDNVPKGYSGKLYLEVVPRSFAVRVREGDTLSQIRFAYGDPRVTHEETLELLDNNQLLLSAELKPLHSANARVNDGLVLSISLPKTKLAVGYHALKNTAPIDLRGIGKLPIHQYWDRIYGDNRSVILEPDEFYIFASSELVRLPPTLCAEMSPFDAGIGEVRTHYAGFFDSGFGYHPTESPERSSAAVVMEVRNRDVPFLIEDGQPLFRVELLHCAAVPDALYGSGSNYQSQRLRLAKQFSSGGEESITSGQERMEL